MDQLNQIIQSDCIEGMRLLPDKSVNCCVTSPPYYGLRDYGHSGQIGLEETPEQFVAKLVEVFREVKRILKDDGTLWLNLGDSYNGYPANVRQGGKLSGSNQHARQNKDSGYGLADKSLKPKDLIGIPWMVAFALRADGWYLRQDIIWHKPNPMPESVTDRCTKSHEYIFLLSKSQKYWYDHEAIKTEILDVSIARMGRGVSDNHKNINGAPGQTPHSISKPRENIKAYNHSGEGDKKLTGHSGNYDKEGNLIGDGMANKKSVWTVTTKPYSEAHFATYPPDLIVDCIKAGCPEYVCNKCGKARDRILETETVIRKRPENFGRYREINGQPHPSKGGTITTQIGITDCGCNAGFSPGIVLDPFMGAGTTAMVARKLNRNYVGFELNPEYIRIAQNRLQTELGLFA